MSRDVTVMQHGPSSASTHVDVGLNKPFFTDDPGERQDDVNMTFNTDDLF